MVAPLLASTSSRGAVMEFSVHAWKRTAPWVTWKVAAMMVLLMMGKPVL
jgi:hypothetical protein